MMRDSCALSTDHLLRSYKAWKQIHFRQCTQKSTLFQCRFLCQWLVSHHDDRLNQQPNAVNGPGDCTSQMTTLAFIRTVRPHFFSSSLNYGPFVFSLTDLHTSNIFVDKDWNITSVITLEWATSLPLEFM